MNGSHNDAEADDQTVVTLASSMAVGPPDNNNNNINNKNHKLDLLTVFQAAPLAGMNQNGKFQAVGDLDLEFERELLKKTFIGSQIAVDFEIATTDALGSFLARDQGRILHFSCHGSPHCLLLEDNWGGVCTLQTEQIKRWIEVGGKNLQFVFVSACYSSLIGQAFVDANVPHVVCCRYDSKIREAAAVEFEKTFYRNLAHGKTLKDAFDMACHEILVSPTIAPEHRRKEVEKFCLFPREADHHVPIFFQRPITVTQKKRFIPPVLFPPPPHVFLGRDVDQFHILRALQSSRLVRVSGSRGVGKTDLVKAVCAYANHRLHMVGFHDILWVPYQEEIRSGEPFCLFQEMLALVNDSSPAYRFFDSAQKLIVELVDYFQLRKTLLVIDAKGISTQGGLGKLSLFLEQFIKGTQNVKVIVIHQLGDEITTTKMPTIEQQIRVDPLSYDCTVKLFAVLCPRLVSSRSHGVSCASDLHALLVPSPERSNRMTKRMALIFKMIGEGNPLSIHNVARDMTRDMTHRQYEELLLLGKQNDDNPLEFECIADLEERLFELQKEIAVAKSKGDPLAVFLLDSTRDGLEKQKELYSRAAVERRQKELLGQVFEAAQKRDFLRAQELQTIHDDLETQKQHLPTIHQLKIKFDEITFEIEHAVSAREWLKARRLQTELDRVEASIRLEMNAENASLLDADKELMATRASMEARIMQLELDYKEACAGNNFQQAREIDAESKSLQDARSTKPAAVDLARRVRKLEHDLEKAKVERNIDTAEMVFKRLEETRTKLKLEEDAETTLGVTVASDDVNNDKNQNGPISLPPSTRPNSGLPHQRMLVEPGEKVLAGLSSLPSDPPGDVGARTRLPNASDEKARERNERNSVAALQPPRRTPAVPRNTEPEIDDEQEEVTRRSSLRGHQREPSESLGPSPGAFRIPGPDGASNDEIEPMLPAEVSILWCWKETSADLSNYTNRPSITYGDPKDGWIKYRRRHNATLEAAFQVEGQKREYILEVSPHTYKVDFDTMTQTNVRTGYTRAVRRIVEDTVPAREHLRDESYLPAVVVSALPNATEVSNAVLDEQLVLEKMIVDTLRKHTVEAQQVVAQGAAQGTVALSNNPYDSDDEEESEDAPDLGIKKFFKKFRSKRK